MDRTIIVSIGRNIGDEPMIIEDWTWFREEIEFLVQSVAKIVVTTDGVSSSTVWGSEDSFTIVANVPAQRLTGAVNYLQESFPGVASLFQQDAIALTFGETVLVEPRN